MDDTEKLRKQVLNKWTKLYNSKLTVYNNCIKRNKDRKAKYDLAQIYINKFKKH